MTQAAVADVGNERLFSPKTVLWMVLVSVFAFCGFMALSAYAPDLASGSDGRAHALSKSAIGYGGMVELLKHLGEPVLVTRGKPPPIEGDRGLLVLTPERGTDPKDIMKVRFAGPILLVLPKWDPQPDALHAGWVIKGDAMDSKTLAKLVEPLSGSVVIARRKGVSAPVLGHGESAQFLRTTSLRPGKVEDLQTISGADLIPVLNDETGRTVLALSKKRAMFVLSDPDLINTHGLADVSTARTAFAILRQLRGPSGPVVFDVTLNGFERGRSLLRVALEPPFLGATLCLLAAAALMGLHAVARFGPPARSERELALGPKALADNSAALVRMAKREPAMGAPYAALVREEAARAVGAPRDLDSGQLDALLDRLGQARGAGSFSAMAAEASHAKTGGELIAAAKRLHDWKLEMTRERR